MLIIQAIILGLVQGLTEFIPVSSSGHLILAERLLGFQADLAFDVALHIGTLLALLWVFGGDFVRITRDMLSGGPQRQLGWLIGLATLPAVLAGLLIDDLAKSSFRSTSLVAMNLILVAIIMLWAESRRGNRQLNEIAAKQAVGVGLAQAVALVPGVSRSGATISAGLFAGMDRVTAARFSFLLSAPAIAGAIIKTLVLDDVSGTVAGTANSMALVAGVVAAALSGFVAIKFLLGYLSRHGLAPFAYYRLVLGAAILIMGVI